MPKEVDEGQDTRSNVADRLRAIADQIDEDGDADFQVRNRTISLQPPDSINYMVEVREKSTRFRGDRESVTVKIDWKPGSESEAE
jgi:amphi-Trp domain-containing protein